MATGDALSWLTSPETSPDAAEADEEAQRTQARAICAAAKRSGALGHRVLASGLGPATDAVLRPRNQALAAAEDVAETVAGLPPRSRAARHARLRSLLTGALPRLVIVSTAR